MEETKDNHLPRGERFAIVDEHAKVNLLSREEFDSMKKLNPRLIEMKACDIVYLTEPPHTMPDATSTPSIASTMRGETR